MIAAALIPALALGLLLAAPPHPPPEEPPDGLDLAGRLEASEAELEDAERFAESFGRYDPAAIERARKMLAPSGEPWLVARLPPPAAAESERRVAIGETLARIRAARAELEAAERVPAGGSGVEPREAVAAVLSERQFEEEEKPEEKPSTEAEVLASWWQRLVNWWHGLFREQEAEEEASWLGEWLGAILKPLGKVLGAFPWGVIGFGVFSLLAALLLFFAFRYLRVSVPAVGALSAGAGWDSIIAEAIRNEADHFLAEGARLLGKGDLRGAVRAYYVGVLSALHHRRILTLEPSLTNWEHAALLRPRADLHARFVPATRTFDYAWYGRLPVERERVLEIARLLEGLIAPEAAAAEPRAGGAA